MDSGHLFDMFASINFKNTLYIYIVIFLLELTLIKMF